MPPGSRGPRRGRTALLISAGLLLLAAAGAAAVIFIPSLSALAGIDGAAPSSGAPTVSGSGPATASASATSSAASPSATATPTFQMAPVITSPPPVAETAPPANTSLDLGLAIPVDLVPCNGQYLTFYYSAITPGTYASEIQASLDTHPGSRYLVTEGSCSALNQVSKDGTRIYGVYSGPYTTAASACLARAGESGAYVKVMNPSTNSESTVACG
ncbi:hypothetical protein [Pseudarthrobacter sp. Y6]|uniref:hypothetical protein n=1 Tax=Pseudarthrobacter sp. Y6 TaxID=3418422 RepID=UPI003CEE36EA